MSDELYLTEISTLRGEINSIISRMNGNENFVIGTFVAIFAFILKDAISLIDVVLAVSSLLIVGMGAWRYIEQMAHIRRIDKYIENLERNFTEHGGWTAHFYNPKDDASHNHKLFKK